MMTYEQLMEVSKNTQDAADFLMAFQSKAHLLDDVIDCDVERTEDEHANVELNWMFVLARNPFFQTHAEKILPVLALGMNAWQDSNVLRKSVRKRDRIMADVVKGVYHEVLWLVALICGGYEHMRAMSTKYRSYDFEEH